ncbi:hypothetical protein MN116_004748 [Schistosoma mekongi]|uniref:Ubiquitin carboxyl-terminal hydrolase n=1 Tax=Schistosoma mekongi TaxID=38744 RepID=A0AAE2D4V5_SCHME|nr:hypothetical protein MN116_004748 [Schistosoma mekongi]
MRWIPLEANPQVLNEYMNNLGVVEGPWKFIDIFSLDDAMLAFIPEPVISLLFLYPLETSVENASLGVEDNSSNIILIKQTVSNACGTIAILHAIANNRQHLSIKDGSFLSSLLDGFENKTPNERGVVVESKKELSALHEKSALEGQTEAPAAESKTNLHFVCFVEHDGSLYELDGRKNAPILHGSITSAGFLRDACNVVKKFILCLPGSVDFSLMALCPDDN